MDKKKQNQISIVLAIAIVLIALFVLVNGMDSFKFEFEKEKVLFASNEAAPLTLMKDFGLNDTVFVSQAIFDSGSQSNSLSASFNLLQVVFIGNDKNTVGLWRIVDNKGNLLSCRTNNGDIKQDIELSKQDCEKILNDKSNAIVLSSLPVSGKSSRIIFSKNRIEVIPDKVENAANVSFVFLKAMYDNAELIIKKTNQFTQYIK